MRAKGFDPKEYKIMYKDIKRKIERKEDGKD